MSDKWMQLVTVRFDTGRAPEFMLYRAPRFKCEIGDTVLVEKPHEGSAYGRVVFEETNHIWKDANLDKAKAAAKGFGAEWPLLPVLKIVKEYDLDFDAEDWQGEEEEDNDTV